MILFFGEEVGRQLHGSSGFMNLYYFM